MRDLGDKVPRNDQTLRIQVGLLAVCIPHFFENGVVRFRHRPRKACHVFQLNAMKQAAEDGWGGSISDTHHSTFNTNSVVIPMRSDLLVQNRVQEE